MRYEGHNGQITIDAGNVVITREGALARTQFLKDSRWLVPFQALSGVRFEDANRLHNGRFRILILDQQPPAYKVGEVGGDEVIFTRKHREEFAGLRDELQRIIDSNREQGVDFSALVVAPPPQSRLEATQNRVENLDAQQMNLGARSAGVDITGALFVGTSHDSGRNAIVALYPDRIERVQAKSRASLSRARQEVEITPVRAISSVQTKKDGALYTKVFVYASGNNIEFKFTHGDANRFRSIVTEQLTAGPATQSAPAALAAPTVDVADQLTKLAALKAQGILTDEEFAAQKAKLLA